MARPPIRILGIDPALRASGFGMVCGAQGRVKAERWTVLQAHRAWTHTMCLARLHAEVLDWLGAQPVTAVALEDPFWSRNVRTAITLGEVRGVVLAACGQAGVPVFGYAPREVKQAVAGRGAATKEQVQRMLSAILGITDALPEDASDALAVALCHEHRRSGRSGLERPAL